MHALRVWEGILLESLRERESRRAAYGESAEYAEWLEGQLGGKG